MYKNKPNILFLMTDEQRFDCIGFKNAAVKTPNLDKLAKGAVVFDRAYTSNPSCVPARAAIYTGMYPSQCGAPTFITHLPETETTFMSLLKDGGYHTAVIGKQHFGTSSIEKGYSEDLIIDQHNPPEHINRSNSSYCKFLSENGFTNGNELMEQEGRFWCRFKQNEKYYIDSFIGDCAVKWLSERKVEKPWFLTVSFPGPHMPYDGIGLPQEQLYRIEDIDLPKTCYEDLNSKPQLYKEQLATGSGNPGTMPVDNISEEEIRKTRLAYYANMSLIDKKIGEIIEALKARNEYDNTLIIFTSDHGDFMGDFGMVGKGQYLSEVLMRVPFILKPPVEAYKGKMESSFVSTVDIAATCLEAAGIEKPEEMSSRELSYYYIADKDLNDREHIYMEAQHLRAVRTEKYKYIYYKGRKYGELYDLENDPYEKYNLWDKDTYKEIKTELQSILMDDLINLNRRSQIEWNYNAPEV